jgi:tetratricopeptide (TPR) repeat protein
MKIAPGVHLNFNKSSMSLSLGPRGAHYTLSSTGRRTVSAGIPGTGIYSYQTLNPKSARRNDKGNSESVPVGDNFSFSTIPHASLFSSRAEKSFANFLQDIYLPSNSDTTKEKVEKAQELATQFAELSNALNVIIFLHILNEENYEDRLLECGSQLWNNREVVFTDRFVLNYFLGINAIVEICAGIFSTEIIDMQQFGFIWVEVLHAHEKYLEALEVLHAMNPNQLVAISMADIELSLKDFDSILETSSEIINEDDATAILLVFRGIAFREKSMFDASLECLKLALAKKSRHPKILHKARFERSFTYEKLGKLAQARKDLELILVDEPTNEEVLERLKGLQE